MQRAEVSNAVDVYTALAGKGPEGGVRTLSVEFLVDTGAAMVCLPVTTIAQLGLTVAGERDAITANGRVRRRVFSPVRLKLMDRETDQGVMELPDDAPPLLGYLALEALDLCVNPQKQTVEGNPAHDGKLVLDLF